MANIYKQTVVQKDNGAIPKRIIVQYFDDVANQDKQEIVNYSDLSGAEQATYDAFIVLSESKMV